MLLLLLYAGDQLFRRTGDQRRDIGLRNLPLAGLSLTNVNNAFLGFVALSHVLKNELK